MTHSSTATPPAGRDPAPGAGDDPGDSGYGWVMFVTFMAAVLGISFAVAVLALAPSWWMLGGVYAVDLIVTAVVFKVVLGAFAAPAYRDLARSE
jgi:hypothetical protein